MVPELNKQIENKSLLTMVHGPIMETQKKEKNLKDIYFGLPLIQIQSVLKKQSLSLLVQLMENSTFHHQRLHKNEKIVLINHI